MRCRYPAQLLALALFALLPCMAQAQQPMRGTWTLNPAQSDDVSAKINTAVARMTITARVTARSQLRSTNAAYPRVVIAYDEQNVRVDMHGRPSVSSPADGQPVLWQRETGASCPEVRGACVRVTTAWANGGLEQTFAAEADQRVNVFTLSPDGNTLTMNVTVTSPRLPAPLTYRLVYNRAS